MVRISAALTAVLLAGAAQSATLPIDTLDTADVNYTPYYSDCGGGIGCITDAVSLGSGGGNDHFDDAFGISVNGLGYSPTAATAGGGTLELEMLPLGNFDVTVSFRTAGPVIRQLVTVTNESRFADTASVQWHNNTGNDSGQRVIGTSDGDLNAETTDNWVVTADHTIGSDNEVNAWIYSGLGGLLPSSVGLVDDSTGFGAAGEQGFNAIFDLALAAGETRSLVFFSVQEGINADGISGAQSVLTDYADLTSDLSETTLEQIANFIAPSAASVAPAPTPLPAGGLMLLSGFGLIAARRKLLRR